MSKNIVFVDEALHELRPLILELEMNGQRVTTFSTADECVRDILSGHKASIYILDIMLISESVFPEKITDNNMYSGLILGRVIREILPEVPIVFYSSIGMKLGLRYTDTTINMIGNSQLIKKQNISSPLEFWERISPILESGNANKKKNKLLSALSSGVIAQPNFYGLGFDIKQFVKELKKSNEKSRT